MDIRYSEELSVAFLDLLGFKAFVKEDLNGAVELLRNMAEIMNIAIQDDELHPPESYDTEDLAQLALRNGVSSFNVFLPFSDSLIVLGNDPNLFVHQIARFVYRCFRLTSHAYDHSQGDSDPTLVNIPKVTRIAKDNNKVEEDYEHWYPTLFKGGISFGSITLINSQMRIDGEYQPLPNVIGAPYVKAVQLEGIKLKGPRLYCDQDFVDKLNEDVKRFIIPISYKHSKEALFEILWPAFLYNENNSAEVEANDFISYYRPVQVLADHYNKSGIAEHYEQFKILLVRGTIMFFKSIGQEEVGMKILRRHVEKRILRQIPEINGDLSNVSN